MPNDDPPAQRPTEQRDPRKDNPSPPERAPQSGPPLDGGLEQLRDSHT
ncbi:hypothetical protein [Bradyrhizobium sp. Ce-3]|nr:hypothetical protein [Bradyrhizobium sp. Ce-3]GKQ55773.1 hypothetical protein BRSPCE3_66280 [Bradyrhizobium sp. Ce-3]